jgi:hypothetical protein
MTLDEYTDKTNTGKNRLKAHTPDRIGACITVSHNAAIIVNSVEAHLGTRGGLARPAPASGS